MSSAARLTIHGQIGCPELIVTLHASSVAHEACCGPKRTHHGCSLHGFGKEGQQRRLADALEALLFSCRRTIPAEVRSDGVKRREMTEEIGLVAPPDSKGEIRHTLNRHGS